MTIDAKTKIEAGLSENGFGYEVQEWREGEDGPEAVLGRFRVLADNEDEGVFEGDTGTLVVCLVGAPEYGNEGLSYGLYLEGRDGPVEASLHDLEAV